MGIQINGSTDRITAIDGTIDFVSNIGNIGLITASRYELLDSITIGAGSTIIKTSNGNLGVGINAPARNLHVKATTPYIRVESSAANQPATLELWHTRANGSNKWRSDIATIDGGLSFKTGTAQDGAPAEVFRIDSSGRIGIDYTPGSGDGPFNVDVTGSNNIFHLGHGTNNDNYYTTGASGTQYFRTPSANQLVIKSDGKLGIGVDSPQQKLHSHEASSNGNFLVFTNSTTGATGSDGCLFGINSDEAGTIWQQENNYIRFGTNDTERLRIASNGKVSIHTAPYSGGGTVPELYVRGGSGRTLKIHNPNVGTSCIQLTNQTTGEGEDTGFFIQQLGGGDAYFTHCLANKDIVFRTNGGSVGERVRIKSTGELHISDRNSGTAGEHVFQAGSFGIRMQDTGGYNRWNIERNYGGWQSVPVVHLSAQGRVGINQASPDELLHIKSTTATAPLIEIEHNQGTAFKAQIGMRGNDLEIRGSSGQMEFYTGNADGASSTERFKIANDGVAHFAGDVKVLTGDIQMGSGRGINFSPTSDGPTMGSETFDDYEEGTYTPAITNLGSHTTHSDTFGAYTKVGNLVTVRFFYKWTGRSNNGAYNVLLSIPFTSANNNRPGHGSCGVEGCQPHSSDRTSYHSSVPTNSTNMQFRCSGANVSENSFNGSIATSLSAGYFMGVVSYESA